MSRAEYTKKIALSDMSGLVGPAEQMHLHSDDWPIRECNDTFNASTKAHIQTLNCCVNHLLTHGRLSFSSVFLLLNKLQINE